MWAEFPRIGEYGGDWTRRLVRNHQPETACEVGLKKLRPTPRRSSCSRPSCATTPPSKGESFGSGHAAIAFTAVRLIGPHLSTGATAVACALAGGTVLTRVSRGAHHPVDSLAGAAMSLGIAGGLNFVVGRDHHWLSTAPVSTSALPAGPSSR